MLKLIKDLFDSNAREIKRLQQTVLAVNALEAEYGQLTDAALRGTTARLRERLANGSTLDD